MKSMTELAAGELCLPQRPHNEMGAARRKRLSATVLARRVQSYSGLELAQEQVRKGERVTRDQR